MKELKGTTKYGVGKARHKHVVYLNDERGFGQCSYALNHTHDVQFIPGAPEVTDPSSGQVIQPATQPYFVLGQALDGHTHDITDIELKAPPKPDEDEKQVVSNVWSLFKTGRELERKSMKKFKDSEDMYKGDHWDDVERSRLEAMNRCCVSINMIEKNVDQICGSQRHDRTDLKFVPTEEGDQRVADLLNILSKQLLNKCYFAREESKVFEDVVIGGRGIFNVYVDFAKDLRGEIVVEKFPYSDVVFGPHEKEDLSDCEYLIKHKWYSKAKLKQLWEDKAELIDKDYEDLISDEPHVTYAFDQYGNGQGNGITVGDDPLVDIATKEYRILELWQKVYKRAYVITNPAEGVYKNAYGWDKKDIEGARTLDGFSVIEQNIAKFRITKVAGRILLSDQSEVDLPVDDFFLVPVYAKKRGVDFWGKVEPAKDAQRYVNKNYSLALDIGNKMVTYGWFYDATTFPENEAERFKENATSPGFVAEVTDVGRPPVKVEGSKFPSEVVQLMTLGKDQIGEIMNIINNPNGANESGSLFEQRTNQKLIGSEYLFDNLSFAKQKLGRLLVKLIQRYYSPDRIVRIVRNAHAKAPQEMAGQSVGEFTDDEINELLAKSDLGDYDVEVTESQWSPSVRLATFALLRDMQQSGQPIPPEALFEFADMPDATKQKLITMIAQQQQAQSDSTQATADAEIQKTLIAQGQIPPAVAQKFLSPPPSPNQPPNVSDQAAGPM